MTPGIVLAIIAAAVGPLVTYIATVRKLSGRIGTSDASELWKESRAIRDDCRRQLRLANRRVADLEERVEKLEIRNGELLSENQAQAVEIRTLRVRLGEVV